MQKKIQNLLWKNLEFSIFFIKGNWRWSKLIHTFDNQISTLLVFQVSNNVTKHAKKHSISKKYDKPTDYFKNELSKNDIEKLYEIYRLDFEMFGYSADEYFDLQ